MRYNWVKAFDSGLGKGQAEGNCTSLHFIVGGGGGGGGGPSFPPAAPLIGQARLERGCETPATPGGRSSGCPVSRQTHKALGSINSLTTWGCLTEELCTSGGDAQDKTTSSPPAPLFRPRLQELRGSGGGGEAALMRGIAAAGLLSQQLVEGLGGLPVLVLAAGADLLHDPVVPATEPARFGAGREVAGWAGFLGRLPTISVPPPVLWPQQ